MMIVTYLGLPWVALAAALTKVLCQKGYTDCLHSAKANNLEPLVCLSLQTLTFEGVQ